MGAFPVNRSPMQPRIAEGVHDPLYVKALALSDDTTTIVICSADLLSFQWIDVDACAMLLPHNPIFRPKT